MCLLKLSRTSTTSSLFLVDNQVGYSHLVECASNRIYQAALHGTSSAMSLVSQYPTLSQHYRRSYAREQNHSATSLHKLQLRSVRGHHNLQKHSSSLSTPSHLSDGYPAKEVSSSPSIELKTLHDSRHIFHRLMQNRIYRASKVSSKFCILWVRFSTSPMKREVFNV